MISIVTIDKLSIPVLVRAFASCLHCGFSFNLILLLCFCCFCNAASLLSNKKTIKAQRHQLKRVAQWTGASTNWQVSTRVCSQRALALASACACVCLRLSVSMAMSVSVSVSVSMSLSLCMSMALCLCDRWAQCCNALRHAHCCSGAWEGRSFACFLYSFSFYLARLGRAARLRSLTCGRAAIFNKSLTRSPCPCPCQCLPHWLPPTPQAIVNSNKNSKRHEFYTKLSKADCRTLFEEMIPNTLHWFWSMACGQDSSRDCCSGVSSVSAVVLYLFARR